MITTIHGNSELELEKIESGSIDVILTDPPYLYLKNQKLDVPFDEGKIFSEFKRVLKPNGFVVMFGRGESFYRWNVRLADLGFRFKEEIVWNKSHCTSPLMAISRVHETVSIFTKGKGVIRRVKVPYLEMKQHDVQGICQDIKRMSAILRNPKSLEAVKTFIEKNCRDDFKQSDRRGGSIVRKSVLTGDRACNVLNSMVAGMNEKTIIKETRDHYNTIHPTQKPVQLLERLLQLVVEPYSGAVVLDPFAGSMSAGEACVNLGLDGILIEKDKEYFDSGCERMNSITPLMGLFANVE